MQTALQTATLHGAVLKRMHYEYKHAIRFETLEIVEKKVSECAGSPSDRQ